jgi:uncharacterized cupredoxin-like copper-binding protein
VPQKVKVAPWLAIVLAAGGLVMSVWALALMITHDEPATLPTVELGEMYIKGDLEIDQGSSLNVVNAGAVPHNLAVENGPTTPDLNAGQSSVLDTSALAPPGYTVYCSIEGHRAAGMEAQLTIRG